MITSITFQFSYNKSYLNKSLHTEHTYGDSYISDLETALLRDKAFIERAYKLINTLNHDLSLPVAVGHIAEALKFPCQVKELTKHKRTYSCAGLTIHETYL